MKKIFFCGLILISLGVFPLFAWDRFTNDTSYTLGTFSFQKIMRYYFSVPYNQTVTLETMDTTGDTYMYLWSDTKHTQIAKNDDWGGTLCSKLVVTLDAGNYTAFVRSYANNTASTCDLYKNGSMVIDNGRYSGYKVYVGNHEAETLLSTANLSPGSDSFCLLVNSAYNMIGYNDDYNGLTSGITAAEKPYYFIIGSFSDYSEGTCQVNYTSDNNPEYLSLCGTEDRHADSGNCFKNNFDSASYYYDNVLASRSWMFTTNRMNYVDGVDLIYIHAHGSPGSIQDEEGTSTPFASTSGYSGSGHRTASQVGDLEYAAFLSCETVKIVSETTWDWLISYGWQTGYYTPTLFFKGFFEGVHVVVGYHTNATTYTRPFLDHTSAWYHARDFANNLDAGQSIWDAWKNSNKSATDTTQHWLWCPLVDLGEVSSIYIVPQKDEKLTDHKSDDYNYGDGNYYFGWRKFHHWY